MKIYSLNQRRRMEILLTPYESVKLENIGINTRIRVTSSVTLRFFDELGTIGFLPAYHEKFFYVVNELGIENFQDSDAATVYVFRV